jgi:hypothetical protein
VQLGHHVVDDAFEEVLATVDVAVQGHRLNTELLAQPTHRQRRQAVLVDEVDCCLDDQLAGQGAAAGDAGTGAFFPVSVGIAAHACASSGRHPPHLTIDIPEMLEKVAAAHPRRDFGHGRRRGVPLQIGQRHRAQRQALPLQPPQVVFHQETRVGPVRARCQCMGSGHP